MKKTCRVGGSKLNPKSFVQRVLSRTSNGRQSSQSGLSESKSSLPEGEKDPHHVEGNAAAMDTPDDRSKLSSSVKFQSELSLLKSQIDSLQISVSQMQDDNDQKERALAALAKEKEQLALDLKKQRRSNVNLKQQLEDERNFYYKEKEQYCNEMNNFKKIKQRSERSNRSENSGHKCRESAEKMHTEVNELKTTLNQTLEANYNLSVKFLRMKNTKLSLKKQLEKVKERHEKSMGYYKTKMTDFKVQIEALAQEEFRKPIPPSSKKYLHLLKHNGALIHDNLQLQSEIDRLNAEVERLKFIDIRNETNRKLKLIHHNANPSPVARIVESNSKTSSICPKCKGRKADNSYRTNSSTSPMTTIETKSFKSRYSQTPTTHRSKNSVNVHNEKHNRRHKEHRHHTPNECEGHANLKREEDIKMAPKTANEVRSNSKFDLMTISNSNMTSVNGDATPCGGSSVSREAANKYGATRSAPEIVMRYLEKI